MPKGTGRPDTRPEREARERDRAERDRSRQKATRSKQADLQSFGATPTSAEPSPAEARALSDAIDKLGRDDNFMSDAFGIRQEIAINPKTGQYDVKAYKEVSPIGTALGIGAALFGGPLASVAVQGGLNTIGFEDPLGFEIDLGFGGVDAQTSTRNAEKDRSDEKVKQAETQVATATGQQSKAESAIDLAVKDLLEGEKRFTFFDMPTFKLLDPQFGQTDNVSVADLLLNPEFEDGTV